jgi:AraC-like DNA-binding protein
MPKTNNTKAKPSPEIDIQAWKAKLSSYFQKEEPYLQPDITLSELATRLHTNTSVLSAAINTGFGKNFNDFVNQYRVDAFLAKMQSGEMKHFTLLAIAFECGFNSKATFNRAVKKATGKSPSEF